MIKKNKIKSKIKKSKKSNKYLNLFVSDNDKLKIIKLKREYSKLFIDKFGLMSIPCLDEFMDFKESIRN